MSEFFSDFKELPAGLQTSLCIGNFDGLHLGHQKVLRDCLTRAQETSTRSLVFSFDPHPRDFFHGRKSGVQLLLTTDEKIELLQKTGFDFVLLQRFDQEFSQITSQDFIEKVLVQSCGAKSVFVGRDFSFGHRAQGSVEDLKKSGQFDVFVAPDIRLGDETISSTRIRALVGKGKLEEANMLLGYPYFLTGEVQGGHGRGNTIGFPTANLIQEKDQKPANGVYVTLFQDLETQHYYASVTNIGERPTFKAGFSVESHLLAFKDQLRGRRVRLFFLKRLRAETKFQSVEALVKQIQRDIEVAQHYFEEMKILQTLKNTMQLSLSQVDPSLKSFKAINFLRD